MLLPRIVPGSEDEFDKMFLEHGAVLLRGFNFTTAEEFATFYANNPGFKCLHDYFPAEHGRDEVGVGSAVASEAVPSGLPGGGLPAAADSDAVPSGVFDTEDGNGMPGDDATALE